MRADGRSGGLSEQGPAGRRSVVQRWEVEAGGLSTKRSIYKYEIAKAELKVFVDHMEVQPNQN